jgi:hypothetical protein
MQPQVHPALLRLSAMIVFPGSSPELPYPSRSACFFLIGRGAANQISLKSQIRVGRVGYYLFTGASPLPIHCTVIRVYDAAGNVETHEHTGDFKER